jgi:glycosyltransferase involved in cell wall biosynthesis
VDLTDPLRRAGDWLRGREDKDEAAPPERLAELERDVRERDVGLRERLSASVDRFLSPSAFLRARMVEWGLPAERVQHLPTGVDLASFGGVPRAPRGPKLRVGFLGSLVPVKGAHVLLEAWAALPAALREGALLDCYGPRMHDLAYTSQLEALALAGGAKLRGALTREEVPALLRELDLLVVPSVWYENQPLVILEALAARTPLLVSDLGGMAELVEEGVSGWRFAVGDVQALSARLAQLLEAPELLGALDATPPSLATPAEQTAAILAVYEELLRAR